MQGFALSDRKGVGKAKEGGGNCRPQNGFGALNYSSTGTGIPNVSLLTAFNSIWCLYLSK